MRDIGASRLFSGGLAVLALLLWLVHEWLGDTLPIPWGDETLFLVPALSFAHHLNFDSSMVLTHGLYWMPPLIYIVNGSFLAVFGDSLYTVRLAALTEVLMCLPLIALLVTAAIRRPPGPLHLILVVAWACNVQLIVAGNTARPDALCLLFDLAALAAAVARRPLGCLALAGLAAMTHPLLALPACAVAAASVIGGDRASPRRWEIALAVLAAMAVSLELVRFIPATDEYARQYAFQLARKNDRGMTLPILICAVATAAAFLWHAAASRRSGAAALPLRSTRLFALFGCTCLLVYVYGREMWYGPFVVSGLFCLALAAIALPMPRRLAWTPYAGFLACIAASWTLALNDDLAGNRLKKQSGFAGQSLKPADLRDIGEDRRSVHEAVAALLKRNNGELLSSRSLYPDFVDLGAAGRVYTLVPFSTPDQRQTFTLYADDGRTNFTYNDPPPAGMLSGYRCTTEQHIPTPHGHFTVTAMTLVKTGTANAFEPCSGPPQQ